MIVGCASSNYSRGHKALEQEDYDTARNFLQSAIKENVQNTDAVRDMGITLYYQRKVNIATRFLEKALLHNHQDPLTLFYLGYCYEQSNELPRAIAVYRLYTKISPLSGLRKTIEGRLALLLKKQMQLEAKTALTQEQTFDISTIPNNTIAVLYFDNLTDQDELAPLSKGLTDMLITDLSQSQKITVVERARLQSLLEEMALGQSGMIDTDTALRIGKLLGVANMVGGTILSLSDGKLRIDAGISATKLDSVIASDNVSGDLQAFLQLEKDLAFRIFDLLGVHLSAAEREAVQKLPTDNMLAFMEYCRGLDFEDKGMINEAQNAFSLAAHADPEFTQAKSAMNRVDAMTNVSADASRMHPKQVLKQQHPKRGETYKEQRLPQQGPGIAQRMIPGTSDRLLQTARNVSSGFVPGIESRKPTTEEKNPTFGNSVPITVRIPLPRKP